MKTKKNGGNRDWKQELQRLLDKHNDMPSLNGKTLNHNTQRARSDRLFYIFTLLRRAGYMVGPFSLGGNHIEFLMHYWTADPRAMETLCLHHKSLPMRQEPFSASYIQQQLSFLRALCEWTGKRGLVLPARRYVRDPALVTSAKHAAHHSADPERTENRRAMLDKVASADPVVGLQLEVLLAFGLQRRDAVVFCPTLAIVPPHALPVGAGEGDYLAFVRPKRGNSRVRVRLVPIHNSERRAVLERALAAAPQSGSHIGRPGLDPKQAKIRFDNVLRRCGVSLTALGVTSCGRRKEFAADISLLLRTMPLKVQRIPLGTDRTAMEAIYLEVARLLTRKTRGPRPWLSDARQPQGGPSGSAGSVA